MLVLAPLLLLASATSAFPNFSSGAPHRRLSERSPHKGVFSVRAPAGPQQPEQEPVAVVDGLKRVPDEDHPFQAPGPTDRRGPCPGLTRILANHGYISRSGIVTVDEVTKASVDALGMGVEIASLVSILSLAYDGDLLSGKFSIGAPDNRTAALGALQNILGVEGGLDYHNTLEGDASTTRQDAYFGDNHSMDPNLYAQMKRIAAKHGGVYGYDTMKEVLQTRYDDSRARNPTFYWLPVAALVPLGSKTFIANLFANGTYGAGGVPNEATISAFLGARALPDGRYESVPERFPDNWYRRAEPLNIVEALAVILDFILSTDVPFGANAGRTDAFLPLEVDVGNVGGLACFVLTALQANVPSMIAQPLRDVEAIVSQVLDKITPLFEDFGCPAYNATHAQAYKDLSKWNVFGPPPASQDQVYGRKSS
ncbi:Cloroperoxidase [Dentipellis sp. KUC8613]|nr:Cloroperoxidase [Dentipellis sp. KUC8613]